MQNKEFINNTDAISFELHHSCKTLLLEPFIQAHCNSDLSGLIISGSPSPDDLQNAFNEIVFEYATLIKTENNDYLFQISKEIGLLQWHITYVDYAVLFLKIKYDQDIANELISIGYTVPLKDDENYAQSLDRIVSLAKTKVFELDNLIDEYNRLNKTVGGKKQSEEEFIRTVAMLSRFQGYLIDRKSTTVFDFVQIFNNYLADMHAWEKNLNDGQR